MSILEQPMDFSMFHPHMDKDQYPVLKSCILLPEQSSEAFPLGSYGFQNPTAITSLSC